VRRVETGQQVSHFPPTFLAIYAPAAAGSLMKSRLFSKELELDRCHSQRWDCSLLQHLLLSAAKRESFGGPDGLADLIFCWIDLSGEFPGGMICDESDRLSGEQCRSPFRVRTPDFLPAAGT
jgi:hypothetical protein